MASSFGTPSTIRADIEFVPVDHGNMTIDEIHAHVVAIPSPLEWGCFTFGIIQNEDYFTFFAAMDHVHGDATLIGTTMLEANGMYSALSGGGEALTLPDAGSFDDFCVREREYTAALTVDSPGVRAWIDFAEENNGGFPEFPLPLGNPLESTSSDMTSEVLMDPAQTERFESACTAAGARFVGGLFACLAQVEHELTGALTYYGLTPRDSRTAADNFMTQGWFTGLIPITVPIARGLIRRCRMGSAGFFRLGSEHGQSAVLPRVGVGAMVELATAEFSRVELLARWRRSAQRRSRRRRHGPCEQYRNLSDGRFSYQLTIYIFRYGEGTVMAIMHPDNPVAKKSVARYMAGDEVGVRTGRRQRALGARRIAWGGGE